MTKANIRNSTVDFLVFTKDSGADSIEVRVQDGDVWLTQKAIAELFDIGRPAITKHLKAIYESGELSESSTCSKMEQVADATRQARRHIPMTMADWASKLDAFLQFNDAEVLHNKGKVTAAIAKAFAESEFEQYRVIQDKQYLSDFDRLILEAENTQDK